MSSFPFVTLASEGNSRIEIKNSEFIGHARRIFSPEEADAFVAAERKLYPDARHSCYAWILETGMNMSKYSDDGEPSGTAGMPILSLMQKQELTDCVVVVTRYFGGILLGKGGLVRAYTDAAKLAVEDAGLVKIDQGIAFDIRVGYDLSDKVISELTRREWQVEDTVYAADVTITTVCSASEEEALRKAITDKTAGRAQITKAGERELRRELTGG